MALTDSDRVRRLLALPEIKPARVAALQRARVAVVGMGGLGTAAAQALAIQGVGHLTLIDPDVVDATNLSRQALYTPQQVGWPKVDAAADSLRRLRPDIRLAKHLGALDADHLDEWLGGHDLVLDGLDNGTTRDLLNRWAVAHRLPVVFAGAVGYEAMVFAVPAAGQPCLYCLFGSVTGLEEECSVRGVLGPVVGLAGNLQSALALKILLGVGPSPFSQVWSFDVFSAQARVLPVPATPDCPVCGPLPKEAP